MQRLVSLFAVCILALLAAAVGAASGTRPERSTQNQASEMAEKARRLGSGTVVKVRLADGRKGTGVIADLSGDVLTLYAGDGDLKGSQVIRYEDIVSISKKGGSKAVWIVLGVAAAVIIVPIVACAAAA